MKQTISLLTTAFIFITFTTFGCNQTADKLKTTQLDQEKSTQGTDSGILDTATFGNGCFWCTEAIFTSLEGAITARSGYSGGKIKNPSYKEVCSGSTGHAEVIQITFDPTLISFEVLLEAFWASHDPTTLNRQGNDIGTQYRSVIFYHNDVQKKIAEELKSELNSKKVFPNPIVTEISPFTEFYVAESYHQDYYELNGDQPYCTFVIKPKLEKFKKVFSDHLKK